MGETKSLCEEKRIENCRSLSKRLISCDATAARGTWDRDVSVIPIILYEEP